MKFKQGVFVMKHKPNVPTFEKWKAYKEQIEIRLLRIYQAKEESALGNKYAMYYHTALEAYSHILVFCELSKQGIYEERFKYLAYSILWGGTPDYNDSPYLDFEGGIAVHLFLEEREKEIETFIRIQKERNEYKNRK